MSPASWLPLSVAARRDYVLGMTQPDHTHGEKTAPVSRSGLLLLGGGVGGLVLTGLLLWWREGSRLFTDGLIAAIVACF